MIRNNNRYLTAVHLFELCVWISIITISLYAAYTGLIEQRTGGSLTEYMWGYVAVTLILSPILAVVLLSPFIIKGRCNNVSFASLALPTLLLAVLLHIAAWGVSASAWLADLEPEIGVSLWTFIQFCVPLSIVLSITYSVKLWIKTRPSSKIGGVGQESKLFDTKQRWHERWFQIASFLFMMQFALIVIGSAWTMANINHPWYIREVVYWTHVTVVYSVLLLLASLSISYFTVSEKMDDVNWDTASLKITIGPLFLGLAFLLTSIMALVFIEVMDSDFRLGTGVILFVAYGYSFLPSYAVVCVLRLMRLQKSLRTLESTDLANPNMMDG